MPLNVIGIGSRFSGDDEIGLLLVEAIGEENLAGVRAELWPGEDAAGIAGRLLEVEDPILLVDCADMGVDAGQMRCFTLERVRLGLHDSGVSTHGLGLADAVELARILGFAQPIHLIGIQPYDLSPADGISSAMAQRFGTLFQEVLQEVLTLAETL